jgi:uncharacterized protein (TIGR03067 family)
MNRRLLVVILAGFLVAADQPAADPGKKDLELMQGDWAAVSYIRDGQKLPDDDAQALFRTVKGNEYTVYQFRKAIGQGTFTLDATKKPRTIDAMPKGQTQAMRGIYEVDSKTLKLCFAPAGKDRPKDFTAKEGSGHAVTVWEREKK